MSTTLAWEERFSVGLRGIDRQHRELIARVNALFQAIVSARGVEEVESHVVVLKEYVLTHFACEEKLMRRHGFPGYAGHLAEHERFIDALAWTDDLYDHPGSAEVGAARISTSFYGWLVEHFQREDRVFAEYLRAPSARAGAGAVGDAAARR